jgi:hypothetical protein
LTQLGVEHPVAEDDGLLLLGLALDVIYGQLMREDPKGYLDGLVFYLLEVRKTFRDIFHYCKEILVIKDLFVFGELDVLVYKEFF